MNLVGVCEMVPPGGGLSSRGAHVATAASGPSPAPLVPTWVMQVRCGCKWARVLKSVAQVVPLVMLLLIHLWHVGHVCPQKAALEEKNPGWKVQRSACVAPEKYFYLVADGKPWVVSSGGRGPWLPGSTRLVPASAGLLAFAAFAQSVLLLCGPRFLLSCHDVSWSIVLLVLCLWKWSSCHRKLAERLWGNGHFSPVDIWNYLPCVFL